MEIVFGTINNNASRGMIQSEYYLVNKIIPPTSNIDERTKEKFAILFMNRLLFIKFLEEKDLVDRELLNNLIEKYNHSPPPNSLFKAYLSPLFYEVFNKPQKDRATSDDTYRKIPYLNGGLFRQNIDNEEKYDIENKTVKEIIDFIERYRFRLEQKGTKDELNPDIIGFIYEKVINRITNGKRKEQGAYYTPEDVTVNISKNTIYSFLLKKFKIMLKNDYGWSDGQLNKYTSLEQLLDIKERFTSDNGVWTSMHNVMKKIKIIDPACGSGHFLITVLNILTQIQKTIFACKGEKMDNDFKLKYEIITNNIFGSDIDPIAVEISRLRLWLSLISSMEVGREKQTEKLPNIEYNVINGNSLLGITNIDEIKAQKIENYTLIDTKDLKKTEELVQKYKLENEPNKSKEIRNELKEMYKKMELLADNFYLNDKIENAEISTPPLHWPIQFIDVFTSQNPGFDIIIGNPPYGDIMKDKEKELVGRYSKSIDEIAGAFIDRMISLSSDGANLGFIVTFAITFNKDLSSTRHNLITEFEKTTILSFDRDRCRIFSEMSQSVSFLFCENKHKGQNGKMYTSKFYREVPDNFDCPTENIDGLVFSDKSTSISMLSGKHRVPKIGSQESKAILETMKSNTDTLKKIITISGKKAWYRSSGNYWYNAWDYEPYTSSEIKEINIWEKCYDLFLVIMNSNIFYFYFRVYGDGRHMNSDIMRSFPIPNEELINKYERELSKCANNIMDALKKNFDPRRKRFLTSKAKRDIDECDKLLAKLYGFTQSQLDYIINYDKEIRESDEVNEKTSLFPL
jgi:hypothetical protein